MPGVRKSACRQKGGCARSSLRAPGGELHHRRRNRAPSDGQTDRGGRAPPHPTGSALFYSLVETAKANGFEPYLWLRQVLRAVPTATTAEHFEALLPWNLKAEQLTTA